MGSSNVSVSWMPPPLSVLEIDDCPSATAWVAALIRPSDKTPSILDIPTQLTTAYLRSMIPQNWTDQPSDSDLKIWSVQLFDNQSAITDPAYESWHQKLIDFPLNDCGTKICEKLDWQGDPDVSGIGVSATSINQSSLGRDLMLVNR